MTVFTYPDAFNPVDAAGNPRGADMGEANVLAHELMSAVQMALFDGLIYSTRAALYADLAHAENSWALVIGDPTSGYDGLYRKSGASGAGSWSRVGDVPGSGFITATDAGAGTANAIVATSSPAIPATDGAALIALNIFETNTASPVTVAFNGGSALTIKGNLGVDVQAGALKAGMIVIGRKSGSTFRLINVFDGEFLLATNVSGTNAIVATTPTPIPATAGAALITLPISITNTASPVTVAFNGGSALTIKDSNGNDIAVGGLAAGNVVSGYVSGSTFRLVLGGTQGWSPLIRIATDSARRVLEVYDWTGGQGSKPTETGYVGASGLTATIGDAIDIRGPAGATGAGTGDMLAANNLSDVASVLTARGNLGTYVDRAAVAAVSVPADIDNIVVEAYSSAAPSKGRANYRAASSTDYNAMPALLRLTDFVGRQFVINEPTLHLTMAGAVGDGATNDTAAIQACIDWMRVTVSGTTLLRPAVITGGGLWYKVTGSLDATEITLGKGWCMRDIWIHGTGAGKTILDLTASRFGYFNNLHIFGGSQFDSANDPHTGILVACAAGILPCDSHTWINCSVDGFFSHSAYTEYSSEVTLHNGCFFWNRRTADTGKPAYAAVLQGRDTIAMVSDYQTLATGRLSYTAKHFNACRFQKPFGLPGPTVYIEDMASTRFTKPYMANNANEIIVWKLNAGFVPYSITFDGLQIETTGTDKAFLFDGGGSGTFAIQELEISCGNLFTDTAMFDTTGITQLNLSNFNLRIPKWEGTKPTNVFANASTFKIMGKISLPAASDLEAFSSFVTGSQIELYSHNAHFTQFYGTKRQTSGYHLLTSGSIQVGNGSTMTDDTALTITLANVGAASQGKFELWSASAGLAATVFYRATATPLILLSTLGTNVNAVTATTLTGTTGADTKFTIAVNNGVIMLENRIGSTVNYRYAFVSQ